MIKVLSNSQMRAADEYTISVRGLSSETLMRRAGIAIAEEVAKIENSRNKSILVVCGNGNNGGDGYVCASELKQRGFKVKVYSFGGNLSSDCAREKAAYSGEYSQEISGDIIIDCIFGTGLSRCVEGEFAEIIERINKSGALVVSADIPSGLNGDNGKICGCAVKADITVAVAEFKLGFFLGDGFDYCGKVIKRDIGIQLPQDDYVCVYEDGDLKPFYPERKRNSNKGTYGSANIVAGGDSYTGAAILSVEAALRSGCGYVKLTASDKVKNAVLRRCAQTICIDGCDKNCTAIAVGMGCGVSEELYSLIKNLLNSYTGTLIIDADGLNALSRYGVGVLENKTCKVILTPHVKEFSRLTNLSVEQILNDPVNIAKSFAQKHSAVLLLKSAASIITDGVKTVLNVRGTTALAKGGSGDMLSGYVCGSVARGLSAFDSAVCSANTLGIAAEMCSENMTDYCVTAEDVLKNLPNAVKRLTT